VAVRDGAVVFLHRKINLPSYGALEEGKHFADGRYVETFDVAAPWLASVQICADMWNPALVHLAALHGATLLLGPISSAVEAVGAEFDNPSGWSVNARFYAMTYGMPVLICNRVGVENGLRFYGQSRILDPFGKVLAEAGEEEALLTADLDYDDLRRARYLLPTVRDSDLELVAREIDRLIGILGVPDVVRRK
jgi:predicted amidohydrolase